MTAREWLEENGYTDVVALIDRASTTWKKAGIGTRRSWWSILAGGMGGRARRVGDIEFPVLVTAQKHEGVPVTKNAIQRNRSERVPPKVYRGSSLRSR
jgi:hypothetical protein